MEKKEITVVMVGENVDLDKPVLKTASKGELEILRYASGLPMTVAEKYGIGAMSLDYEVMSFVVNLGGGAFVEGYYPYYSSDDDNLLEDDSYEAFYFGKLMLKSGDSWYLADWINPADNAFEMVTFKKVDTFNAALVESLLMAMENYVKKNRAKKMKG